MVQRGHCNGVTVIILVSNLKWSKTECEVTPVHRDFGDVDSIAVFSCPGDWFAHAWHPSLQGGSWMDLQKGRGGWSWNLTVLFSPSPVGSFKVSAWITWLCHLIFLLCFTTTKGYGGTKHLKFQVINVFDEQKLFNLPFILFITVWLQTELHPATNISTEICNSLLIWHCMSSDRTSVSFPGKYIEPLVFPNVSALSSVWTCLKHLTAAS